MTASPFELRIAAAWQRLDELLQDAGGQSDRQALLNQAIAELGTALEELRVSAEELQQQNDDLADARNAIEAERTRYSDLFEFAPDAYVVTDANAVIEEANAAAERLLHRDRQFLAGKPLAVFVDNDSRPEFRERLRRLGNGEVARVEDWEVRLHPQPADAFLAALTVAPVVTRKSAYHRLSMAHPRHQRAQAHGRSAARPRGATAPNAEARGGGALGGRRGARYQQPTHRHQGLGAIRARETPSGPPVPA